MFHYFISVFVFLVIPNVVFATPLITVVNGNVIHKGAVVISGSGFGIKPVSAPILWETFENGQSGQSLVAGGVWSGNSYFCYSDQEQRAKHSNLFLKASAEAGVVSGDVHIKVDSWALSRKKLFTAWFKADLILMNDGQIKIMDIERAQLHATAPGLAESVLWCINNCSSGFTGSNGWGNMVYWYQGPVLLNLGQMNFNPYYNSSWQYIVFEYEESNFGVADGKVNVYKSSTAPLKGVIEKKSLAGKMSQIEEGAVAQYAKLRAILASGASRADAYYDDVYIDNTWQRVELGNNANYDLCTHREIQIPSSWSDNLISISVNQGSFEDSSDVYLFVVDAEGVASNGYPISFDTILPSPPSNLIIR